jgi:hypothetical protein
MALEYEMKKGADNLVLQQNVYYLKGKVESQARQLDRSKREVIKL